MSEWAEDNGTHAMASGMLWGYLRQQGVEAFPVTDSEGYTPEMRISFPELSALGIDHLILTVNPPEAAKPDGS